jgi:hypothetical protein
LLDDRDSGIERLCESTAETDRGHLPGFSSFNILAGDPSSRARLQPMMPPPITSMSGVSMPAIVGGPPTNGKAESAQE